MPAPRARPLGFEVMSDGVVQWVKTGGTLTVNSTETYQAACWGWGLSRFAYRRPRSAAHRQAD